MTEIEFARRHLTVDQQSCKSYAEQELFQEDIDRSVGEEHLAFCILWSPLPFITWLLPFIGHLGIADSKGVVYDFQGPFSIGRRTSASMAFGPITRLVRVNVDKSQIDALDWDEAIYQANDVYKGRVHNIFCDNCHSHVANALNRLDGIKLLGFQKFDMVNLALIMFVRSRFLSFSGFIHQFAPFIVIVLLMRFAR